MAGAVKKAGKGGTRKHGRCEEKCKAYQHAGRREANKVRRLAKRLAGYRDPAATVKAIEMHNGISGQLIAPLRRKLAARGIEA